MKAPRGLLYQPQHERSQVLPRYRFCNFQREVTFRPRKRLAGGNDQSFGPREIGKSPKTGASPLWRPDLGPIGAARTRDAAQVNGTMGLISLALHGVLFPD